MLRRGSQIHNLTKCVLRGIKNPMLGLFARRRKGAEVSCEKKTPVTPIVPLVAITPTSVVQRIHPNLESLAEELTPTQLKGSVFNGMHDVSVESRFQSDTAGFIGLEPSTRRRSRQEEQRLHKGIQRNDHPSTTNGIAEPSQASVLENEAEQVGSARVIEPTESDICLPLSFPSRGPPAVNSDQREGPMDSTVLSRWPTFGRRDQAARHSTPSDTGRGATRSDSQSSLSQPRSRATSHSYFSSEDSQPRTPGSRPHSLYTSTPYSIRVPSMPNDGNRQTLPSPHTFGIRTPTQFDSTQNLGQHESYFNFKGVPPPLPPLDHPAFRGPVTEFGVSSSKQPYSFSHVDGGVATRHSYSLPSMAQSTVTTKPDSTTDARKKKDPRVRSKSSAAATSIKNISRQESVKRIFHSRNQSKSSISSSRRSSAEYSAKQASSIEHGGCWEVDVTKAMISLSLGEGQSRETRTSSYSLAGDAHTSAVMGQARGCNVGSHALFLSQSSVGS